MFGFLCFDNVLDLFNTHILNHLDIQIIIKTG